MGAAIECFKGAGAVAVPRYRFAPVKKCNDLLLLRSDAYVVNEHFNIVLAPERQVESSSVTRVTRWPWVVNTCRLFPSCCKYLLYRPRGAR